MKKILVALDGSEDSLKALAKAKEWAGNLGASIDVLNVVKDTNISPYPSENNFSMKTMDDIKSFGNRILAQAAESLEDFSGQVSYELRTGEAADIIIDEAKKGKHDLIIMGSRGLGRFSRTILGSVSNKVLHHGKSNVLVVKK